MPFLTRDGFYHVIWFDDPRSAGYVGELKQVTVADLHLVDNLDDMKRQDRGSCLGEHPDDDTRLRVFLSDRECRKAGYIPLGDVYIEYRDSLSLARRVLNRNV